LLMPPFHYKLTHTVACTANNALTPAEDM
jgi:hypothetical protein